MDSLIEKFDLFDFFNLIIAGAVFLIGLGFYDNNIQCHLKRIMHIGGMSTFSTIFMIALFIALSYITGLIFNALESLIFSNRYHDKLVKNCLTDSSIVGNADKLKIYQKNANDFFLDNDISIKDNQFDDVNCSCFFAYCVYFIQVKGQNQKAEKLRDVQGLSRLLAISFAMLFLAAIVFVNLYDILLWAPIEYAGILLFEEAEKVQKDGKDYCLYKILRAELLCLIAAGIGFLFVFIWNENIGRQQIAMAAFGFFAALFYLKFKRDVSNRVRLILAVYDICKPKKGNQVQQI